LSTATDYKFPPDLTNHERAIVHSECKKYGFTSKSFGKGDDRAVCIFKLRRKGSRKVFYEFAPEQVTFARIESYFKRFPPKGEEIKTIIEESKTSADGRNALSRSYSDKKDMGHSAKKPRTHSQEPVSKFSSSEIQKKHSVWEDQMKSNRGLKMMSSRNKLPIAGHREEILAKVRDHQVVLIAGETGCGKTTQVPQYILEDCWSRGQPCKIMCTQPRRLSATSVADRIAQERMEPIGSSVGYTIRLDKKGNANTPIMFCTNGIMLRILTSDYKNVLDGITHIVVDEIHERDRFADFMLIIVRDILPRYPEMRLVLMSATLHEELFSAYFGGCPVIRVPGFTFPVEDFFLEDILRVTGYEHAALQEMQIELGGGSIHQLSNRTKRKLSEAIENAFRNGGDDDFRLLLELTGSAGTETTVDDQEARVNFRHPETGATPLFCACFRGKGDIASILLSHGADPSIHAENGMTAADCAEKFGFQELGSLVRQHTQSAACNTDIADAALALSHYQSNTNMDEVDLGLIEEVLLYICGEKIHNAGKNDCKRIHLAVSAVEKDADAILVFLPGWDEIMRLRDILEASSTFGSSKYLVLPLHSMISPGEQKKVFLRPPQHVRKIILSTNIAETAITIDDIAIIIDSGRQKEKSFDPYTGVSTLQSGWISKASVRQRKGRAGRCREGLAFHLYSRQRFDLSLIHI